MKELVQAQVPPPLTEGQAAPPAAKFRYTEAGSITEEQRARALASGLAHIGDAVLVWVNEGDLCRLILEKRVVRYGEPPAATGATSVACEVERARRVFAQPQSATVTDARELARIVLGRK